MVCKVSDTLPQANRWASSHIRAHFPRPTSLLRPENYDFLALNAESGNNVIQFARRSSVLAKRVTFDAQAYRSRPGIHSQFAGNAAENRALSPERQEIGLGDSSISHKRKNGTYNNGPRHSGKAILCFVAVFAGFWLGVAAVSAYVHFSGR